MVTFCELDTEITSRTAFTGNNDDTKADGAIEEPKTKKPCTTKRKDVTFYIPEIPDGLKALTNASDGLRLRKESIVPGRPYGSGQGRGLDFINDAWRQARADLAAPPPPANKIMVRKKHHETRLKRKASQEVETEKVRRMFQLLDTRELQNAALALTKTDKRTWLLPVNSSPKALTLRTVSRVPNSVHPEGKCTNCKKLQKCIKILEGKGTDATKLQRKVHELEDRVARTHEQNQWFRERNEWLESRLKLVEMQHAEQRSIIRALQERNEAGSSSSASSFLPTLSSAQRLAHLHRMTQHFA